MTTKTTEQVNAAVGEDGAERARLSRADRVTLGLLGFFVAVAFTLELYFVLHYRDIRTQDHLFARAFAIYGAGDEAYYGRGDIYVPFALETINVFVTQALGVLVAWGIVKRRAWRHPLQLLVSSYLTYSVVLYFWLNHVSGYANMPAKTWWGFFILYVPNLPWMLGYGWMAWRSFAAITAQLSAARDSARG